MFDLLCHPLLLVDSFGMLGSVDSNTGSPDLGWDTDQFPMDIRNTTLVMKVKCFINFSEYTQHNL